MSLSDDLTGIQNDLSTLSSAVGQAVTDLQNSQVPAVATVGDNLLTDVVNFLTGQGYTVTAPVVEVETPAEDATEPTEEA